MARRTVHEVAPWIARLARVGYVAQGILYLTIGVLSVRAAIGSGRAVTSAHDAMGVLDGTFGRPLLVVIAIGLFGHAVWRMVQAITDAEDHGSEATGIAVRIGHGFTALVHAGLGWAALRLAVWKQAAGGQDAEAEHWTSKLLHAPAGQALVLATAVGIGAFGVYQLYCAWAAKLDKQLELGRMSGGVQRAVIAISRFGIAARGVVFAMIALMFARAAMNRDPREAGGTGDSMSELFAIGRWAFVVIAAGVAAYGIYELINARYRRIRVASAAA